jgi:hypothetical protein
MGLEAESELVNAGDRVHVKALLESHALILRGAVKKTLPLSEISDPRAIGDQLLFEHHGTPYALVLPAGQAAKWLKKLTTAPPSLAAKLGVDPTRKALVWGRSDDAALNAALDGATTDRPAEAALSLAIADSPDSLAQALNFLLHALPQAPIWVVYPKGAKSPLPESAVRNHLRSLGMVDTKVCSVSERTTASRYNRAKSNQL